MSLLDLSAITAFYGPSQALFGVDLTVDEGQVVALMGRNGMGKTTTIKTICRLLAIRSGAMQFAGVNLVPLPAHKAARLGLGLVPEGRRCFAPLTVAENLTAAARPGPWDFAAITELFPRLAERRDQVAQSLSGGEQQMFAIARALVHDPLLLILDEATEGLAPLVRQEIWAAVRRLKTDTGLAILVVDKSLRELRAIADHAVILDKGRSVWTGTLDTLGADLTNRYLGV